MPDGYRLLWAGWYRLDDGAGPHVWDGASSFTLKGSGGGAAAVGGAALLDGETAGFATDFTYATDASRVAVKVAGVNTSYALDSFYTNASTSPKMVYDVAGVLGWSPHNLMQGSQTFDNATYWNPSTGVTFTANAIAAPDGTLTAEKMTETGAGAGVNSHNTLHVTNITQIPRICVSIYAKAGERTWLGISQDNGSAPADYFDLANGVIGNTANNAGMLSVGNGWYRCWMSSTLWGRNPAFFIRQANGGGNYTGDGVSGLYLWGAQANHGSTPTSYVSTTSAARNGLAVDYDPVTHASKGLLCEPQATNLVLQSQALDVIPWTLLTATLSTNAIAAPDGTTTADKLVETAGAGEHKVYANQPLSAVAYTFSIYVKAAERTWMCFTLHDGSYHITYFNLGTGTLGTVAAGVTAAISSVGNGWYRCSVTRTVLAASVYYQYGTATGDGVNDFTGVAGSGLYVWGAQVETGTVATSYIPTTTATVTRAADVVSVTSASINYSATAGSWWVDADFGAFVTNGRVVCNTTSSHAPLYEVSATRFGVFEPTALSGPVLASVAGRHKVACAYQTADRAISADGLAALSDTGSAVSLLAPGAAIFFGTTSGGTAGINVYIRKVYYLPRRMTNPQLVTATT